MTEEEDARSAAAVLGRRGGEARAKSLTAARRKAIAKKAIATRWEKARAKKKGKKSA